MNNLAGAVREMLKAHEYDEIQTFTNLSNAKADTLRSLQTVVEESDSSAGVDNASFDPTGEVGTLPNGKQVKIQVQGESSCCHSHRVQTNHAKIPSEIPKILLKTKT